MTRDDARALWAASGLTYDALTDESLGLLTEFINMRMAASGTMNGSLRMKRGAKVKRRLGETFAELRCKAYYFADREALTFNPGGFVGFAGWADDVNVAPILAGFAQWVAEMTAHRAASAA